MLYRFYGEPNMLVKELVRKPFSFEMASKPLFRFDAKGVFETDDPKLIAKADKLKRRFKFEEVPVDEVPVPVETKEEAPEPAKQETVYRCKKCEFECNNSGVLMQHYRTAHPKN